MVRIAIVEDHPVVVAGLEYLIESEEDLTLISTTASRLETLKSLESDVPDLLIVDLILADGLGIQLIEDVLRKWTDMKILVLSMQDEQLFADRCLSAGARGYVSKRSAWTELVNAIRVVASGRIYLPESLSSRITDRHVDPSQSAAPALHTLTNRELSVYEAISQGLPVREIAKRLHVSPKTVETYRDRIRAKLGLESATDLLRHATIWSITKKDTAYLPELVQSLET